MVFVSEKFRGFDSKSHQEITSCTTGNTLIVNLEEDQYLGAVSGSKGTGQRLEQTLTRIVAAQP